MEKEYIEGQQFDNIDFSVKPLALATYENCRFVNCRLAGTNLSQLHFTDCVFSGCDLSNALLGKTAFNNVAFEGCKMLGLRFDHCHEVFFAAEFGHCHLGMASFYQRQLKKTVFAHCNLQGADFSEANLTGASFDHCDLADAVFENTHLEKADFSTALHYTIDPQRNNVHKAKFSQSGLAGLLRQYGIEVVG
jgi:fluoroquinolone resistance protein